MSLPVKIIIVVESKNTGIGQPGGLVVQVEPGLGRMYVRGGIDHMDIPRSYATVALLHYDLVCRYRCRALLDPCRSGDGVGIGLRVVNQSATFDINWQIFSFTLRAQVCICP